MSANNKKEGSINNIRKRFPIFSQHGNRLAYLDTAASAQKPDVVIETLSEYFKNEYANVHRGAYHLSAVSSSKYEQVRQKVASLINAKDPNEIVFTGGTTDSVNLVANCLENIFSKGDVILLSTLEHHSNIVPWQLLAKRKNLKLEYINVTDKGHLDYVDAQKKISDLKPKLISITSQSNLLGTIVDLAKINEYRSATGSLLFIDAAQSVAHEKLDVQSLNADFLVFSGHKLYGPNGVGVLYAKKEYLDTMSVYRTGGGMITHVGFQDTTYAQAPWKFEAGTPAIAEVIALGAAIDFLNSIGIGRISKIEKEIFDYAVTTLKEIDGVTLYGPYESNTQSTTMSFNVDGVHPHDMATLADSKNVQVRAGHHCAMPLLKSLNVDSTVRMSLGMYSEKSDIDMLVESIHYSKKVLT